MEVARHRQIPDEGLRFAWMWLIWWGSCPV